MTTEKQEAIPVAATSLVLRVCRSDYTSHGGFKWPKTIGAEIAAPDWRDSNNCGNGLHGWLYGRGDYDCVNYWRDPDAKWYVLEVVSSTIVMLGGKCKFPKAVVRFVGSKAGATAFILAHEERAQDVAVIGAERRAGDKASVVVGALGTATTGDDGTATAGYAGTATAGEKGEIRIRWWDQKAERYRTVIGYAGEDGIKPNTPYRLDDNHKFIEALK